ncbi:MAG: esterase/lipase family protein [Woeseiaceae bacterium]
MDESRSTRATEGRSELRTVNTVVCLHGVWMPGVVMTLVKRRLESEYQYRAHLFSYPSLRGTLDENARSLAGFVAHNGFDKIHLVGHSLGGVVALRMLALEPEAPVHRVVCRGSPLCGSRAASHLNQKDWGNTMLGKSVTAGVVDEAANQWAEDVCKTRDIGVIAGTVPVGVGRLLTSFDEDNDGTVAVSETRLPGVKDHLCMPVTHKGLVVSNDVIDQAAAFLKRGEFLREP